MDDILRDPLTPSQLVIDRQLLSAKGSSRQPRAEGSQTVHELSKREKYLMTVFSQLWKRWQKEYLTELRVHHNYNLKNRQP